MRVAPVNQLGSIESPFGYRLESPQETFLVALSGEHYVSAKSLKGVSDSLLLSG